MSNVTGHHRGLKRKRTFVCRYVAPFGECYYNSVLCCDMVHNCGIQLSTEQFLCCY